MKNKADNSINQDIIILDKKEKNNDKKTEEKIESSLVINNQNRVVEVPVGRKIERFKPHERRELTNNIIKSDDFQQLKHLFSVKKGGKNAD
jgi:hypothetical protein